jgi:hypothetical protein
MSPQARQVLVVVIVLWHVGWLVYVVLFARAWLRRRRVDPGFTPQYFPWDRVLISGLFGWWLYFIVDVRNWLVRRRRGR